MTNIFAIVLVILVLFHLFIMWCLLRLNSLYEDNEDACGESCDDIHVNTNQKEE